MLLNCHILVAGSANYTWACTCLTKAVLFTCNLKNYYSQSWVALPSERNGLPYSAWIRQGSLLFSGNAPNYRSPTLCWLLFLWVTCVRSAQEGFVYVCVLIRQIPTALCTSLWSFSAAQVAFWSECGIVSYGGCPASVTGYRLQYVVRFRLCFFFLSFSICKFYLKTPWWISLLILVLKILNRMSIK